MNSNLKKLYDPYQSFDQVLNQLQSEVGIPSEGIFYKVIQILCKEDKKYALEIYDDFGITSSASPDQDVQIISTLIETSFLDTQFENLFRRNFQQDILKNTNELDGNEKMEIIKFILVGCFLLYVAYRFAPELDKKRSKTKVKEKRKGVSSPQPDSYKSIDAYLCLVVLSKRVINVRKNDVLDKENLSKLIDGASHLLCVKSEDVYESEQFLNVDEDNVILPDSNREVYIRIKVNDGQKLIGETFPYYLQSNLSLKSKGIVEEIFCLKNLSGLQAFNRI
jgi:hypothetical protein